jgi:hypothetical protein
VEGSAVRPAALSNPSQQGFRSNEFPIKPPPPTRFRNAGGQHSFVQQNPPHRIDQPANLNSSDLASVYRLGTRDTVQAGWGSYTEGSYSVGPLPGGEELAPLELSPDAGSDDPLVGAIDVPEEE